MRSAPVLLVSALFAAACGGDSGGAGTGDAPGGQDAAGGADALVDAGEAASVDADSGGAPDAGTLARRGGSSLMVRTDRISMNGLNASHLDALLQRDVASVHALAGAAISAGFVSDARMVLATGAARTLAASAYGRALLGYLTRCAFNKGDELAVHDAAADVTYVFHGGMALARGWEFGPLSVTEQRWVSACVMAHVNYADLTIPVLLRGAHPQLGAPADLDTADWMSVREAGLYGNLFVPGQHDPSQLNVCTPQGWLALRYQTPDWQSRMCTDGSVNSAYTACGFVNQGQCYPDQPFTITEWLRGGKGAIGCEAVHSDGYYQPCCEAGPYVSSNEKCVVDTDVITGYTFQRYDEVITVYLRDLQAPELAGTVAPTMTVEQGNTAAP